MPKPIAVFVAICMIALMLYGAMMLHSAAQLDPLVDRVVALLTSTDTVYAPGYSEHAFRQAVRTGTSEQEVRALLGPPLSETPQPNGRHWAHYSKLVSRDRNWWQRVICFRDGRVDGFMAGLID